MFPIADFAVSCRAFITFESALKRRFSWLICSCT
jgi:hypothetical protein